MEIKGYIGEANGLIYFTDGVNVYRAPETNVIDCDTGYLIGRWECSLNHFEVYRKTVYSFVV